MGKARLGIAVSIVGTAYWGSPHKEVALGLPISTCLHAGLGKYLPCIRGQYIKGLIRRWCERLEPLLKGAGIISTDGLTDKLFGPSVISGSKGVTSVPSPLIVADAYPVKDVGSARDLFSFGELNYLMDTSGRVVSPNTELVARIRIDDLTGKVAEGALFHEVRVAPGTTMYFELVVRGLSDKELFDAVRLLLTSASQLSYSSVGRVLSVGEVLIAGLEPDSLLQDRVIKLIAGWLR